jgi:predicted glutamine amidotransferase
MCMLCVIPPNTVPSRDKLENSALNNPDGFGFAIVIRKENRIHTETTMNADTSINRFLEMRQKYPEGYAMWHARMATHGSVNVDNCHPFKVGDDSRTYLGHNGVLNVLHRKDDKRSDTRIFAEDILPKIGGVSALDDDQIFNMLEDYTAGSKVCILTLDPKAKAECYLLNEKAGKIDDTGVWWSNDSCDLDYYGNKWYSRNSLNHLWQDDYYKQSVAGDTVRNPNTKDCDAGSVSYACVICSQEYDEEGYAASGGQCFYCGSCLECNMTKTECDCYTPLSQRQKDELNSWLDITKQSWTGGWSM